MTSIQDHLRSLLGQWDKKKKGKASKWEKKGKNDLSADGMSIYVQNPIDTR